MHWSLKWQDWAAIFGLLFGIVSLIAYYEQRRSASRSATLLKWAALNLDKSISEEQIKALSEQKTAMEEQIARKLPALARTAVLQEQAQLHEKLAAEHFIAWQAIKREQQTESDRSGLDPQLQRAILDLIVPRYMRLDRRDRLRTRVTVLSVALAAFSAVLPFPLNSALGILMALPLLYAGARLYVLNEDTKQAYKIIRPYCHLCYICTALTLGAIGLYLFLFSVQGPVNSRVGKMLLVAGGFLVAIYLLIRRWIDKGVARLCNIEPLYKPD